MWITKCIPKTLIIIMYCFKVKTSNNAQKKIFWFIIHNLNLYILIIYTNSEICHFKYWHDNQLKTVFFFQIKSYLFYVHPVFCRFCSFNFCLCFLWFCSESWYFLQHPYYTFCFKLPTRATLFSCTCFFLLFRRFILLLALSSSTSRFWYSVR